MAVSELWAVGEHYGMSMKVSAFLILAVSMGIISEKSLISTQVLVYRYTLVFVYFVCFISQ